MTEQISIIPKPASLETKTGFFIPDGNTAIIADKANHKSAEFLQNLFSTAEMPLSINAVNPTQTDNSITLHLDPALEHLGDEGCSLEIQPEKICLTAFKPTGVYFGIQTLRQLVPADGGALQFPCVEIEDRPRFSWRGMMLDTARHMFSVKEIKQLIDQMAFHKYNRFHWHITDDQGWRIEIKKYPRLTEIGSHRKSSPVLGKPRRQDGVPYGGFYTQEDIREIVEYAADQHITVVPEIDMPGHALAALAAYPDLGCTGGPYEVWTKWGIEYNVYCAGSEKMYAFLEDVLTEVLELFPSEVIHIGGDEVPKDRWQECPRCQAKMAAEGLANEEELQSYFIRRMGKFLESKGRRFMGWDEILEGGLAPGAMVMSWRGMQGGIEACNAGHDVIMTPITNCYLDYRQHESRKMEPPAIRSVLLLEDAYNFEPVPETISPEKQEHILGIQANIWTEYITTFDHLQYMVWPRGSALAEVAWSGPERDYEDFSERLKPHLQRMKKLGANYRDPFIER